MKHQLYIVIALIFSIYSCKKEQSATLASNVAVANLTHHGRVQIESDSAVALITPASSIEFMAQGEQVTISAKAKGHNYNYISVAINDDYVGRFKVSNDTVTSISLPLPAEGGNKIGVYKATEASIGDVSILAIQADEVSPIENSKSAYTIEFIGNSITCGMGADLTEIPCGEAEWFDQHNAYLAYGPVVSRKLGADYVLNSVSGMGMYRNWNDEGHEPVMPQVYKTLRLDGKENTLWQSGDFQPNLVSICLGTNDLSDGDGEKERLAFDTKKYTEAYIGFVEMLFEKYPDTKLALLTSPMVGAGEKSDMLLSCLQNVKAHFDEEHVVEIFQFEGVTPTGCGYHPSIKEHKEMAESLLPFYKKLLIE